MRQDHVFAVAMGLLSFSQSVTIAHTEPVLAQIATHPHGAFIAEATQRFGIPAQWIIAVMRAESSNDPRAVSPSGAMGLMQIMPDTWAALRSRHGLCPDPHQPRCNILAGTAYLREMWDRYGNARAMLAAYNAGPGRYDAYLETGRALPAETRAYVTALAPLLDSGIISEVFLGVQTGPQ